MPYPARFLHHQTIVYLNYQIMKNQQDLNRSGNMQGNSTSDRAFTDQKATKKQAGISNGGGQRSDQTSNRDNDRKIANKK
jgi:hypothetical protein